MRGCLAILICILVSMPFFIGCAHMTPAQDDSGESTEISIAAQPEVVVAAKRYKREYVLGPGDQLEISLRRLEGKKVTPMIRPDGYISLPYIKEEIKAGGLTPQELNKKLTDLLSQRFVDPEVTVMVTQTRMPQVYVLGEVKNPMPLDIHNTITAMQAIAQAGGFNEKAAQSSVMIIRIRDDARLVAMRITPELYSPEAPYLALNNVVLDPYDIVFVPKTFIAKVSTFFEEHINKIFGGINAVISTYTQFRLIELLDNE